MRAIVQCMFDIKDWREANLNERETRLVKGSSIEIWIYALIQIRFPIFFSFNALIAIASIPNHKAWWKYYSFLTWSVKRLSCNKAPSSFLCRVMTSITWVVLSSLQYFRNHSVSWKNFGSRALSFHCLLHCWIQKANRSPNCERLFSPLPPSSAQTRTKGRMCLTFWEYNKAGIVYARFPLHHTSFEMTARHISYNSRVIIQKKSRHSDIN